MTINFFTFIKFDDDSIVDKNWYRIELINYLNKKIITPQSNGFLHNLLDDLSNVNGKSALLFHFLKIKSIFYIFINTHNDSICKDAAILNNCLKLINNENMDNLVKKMHI